MKVRVTSIIFILFLVVSGVALSVTLGAKSDDFVDHPPVQGKQNTANSLVLVQTETSGLKVYRFTPSNTNQATVGANSQVYNFYIQGGLHGNEKLTTDFVVWLIGRIQRGESLLNSLVSHFSVSFDLVPNANSFGYQKNQRNNEHAVNLNRNFNVLWGLSRENPGNGSFSEKETQAIQKLFLERHYFAAVDVHGYANMLVAPSQAQIVADFQKNTDIDVSDHKRQKYLNWLDALHASSSQIQDYHLDTAYGLGDGGAFEDWAFWQQDAYAYCLEMHSSQRFDGTSVSQPTQDTFLQYEQVIYQNFLASILIENKLGPSNGANFNSLVNYWKKTIDSLAKKPQAVH